MIENYSSLFTPGIFVINPNKKNEWGIGQIQSSINNLITVNFENVGKKTINLSKINLEIININAASWSISSKNKLLESVCYGQMRFKVHLLYERKNELFT